MKRRAVVVPLVAALAAIGFFSNVELASSQSALIASFRATDPGVRDQDGPPGAGGEIANLTGTQHDFFVSGLGTFNEVDVVAGGLGPRMNLDSCAGCHAQPAVGGTSPGEQSNPDRSNPQVAFANAATPSQLPAVAAFISADGPVREARFVRNPDGTPDGGVHALFTITGRTGADVSPPGPCRLAQPDFATQLANHNVIFRIPTPVFGAGLIEQIEDRTILANRDSDSDQKSSLGIRGKANFQVPGNTITGMANHNGNDGTIARFGWKAQNKSLLLFSGEAYNVEQGITNELFQTEREENPACQFKTVPNDVTNTDNPDPRSDIERFAIFMRFLAPPTPSTTTPGGAPSIAKGRSLFSSIGCALCHTPALTTNPNSQVAALSNQQANLFSDILVHDMGDGLADGVSQGQAGPREFRSAPLWGLGKRIFFLHDGRTSDLIVAIRAHASTGSEANGVVARFYALSESSKQDLLNFLRSL